MWSPCLLVMTIFLVGCSTVIKRDGRCLASLTPEFLNAQEDLAAQERAWRSLTSQRNRSNASADHLLSLGNNEEKSSSVLPDPDRGSQLSQQTDQGTTVAYQKLMRARHHYQSLFDWYQRVYARLRTRLEEAHILAETFIVLLGGGPTIALYPIVRWNIRSVIWDGSNPDAETDPVTQYCTERLSRTAALAEARSTRPENIQEQTNTTEGAHKEGGGDISTGGEETSLTLGHNQSDLHPVQ